MADQLDVAVEAIKKVLVQRATAEGCDLDLESAIGYWTSHSEEVLREIAKVAIEAAKKEE